MPHASTPTLALVGRWSQRQRQRIVCTTSAVRNFRNDKITIGQSKKHFGPHRPCVSVCVCMNLWANTVLLLCFLLLLPRRVLSHSHRFDVVCACVRLYHIYCICCVHGIDMRATITLVTYAVTYSAHRYARKKSYDTHAHAWKYHQCHLYCICYHVLPVKKPPSKCSLFRLSLILLSLSLFLSLSLLLFRSLSISRFILHLFIYLILITIRLSFSYTAYIW